MWSKAMPETVGNISETKKTCQYFLKGAFKHLKKKFLCAFEELKVGFVSACVIKIGLLKYCLGCQYCNCLIIAETGGISTVLTTAGFLEGGLPFFLNPRLPLGMFSFHTALQSTFGAEEVGLKPKQPQRDGLLCVCVCVGGGVYVCVHEK